MNVPNIVVGGYWNCPCGRVNLSSAQLCAKCQTPRGGKANAEGVNSAPREEQESSKSAGLREFTLHGEDEVAEIRALLELRQALLEKTIRSDSEHSESSQWAKAELEVVQSMLSRLKNEQAHHETTAQMREMAGRAVEKFDTGGQQPQGLPANLAGGIPANLPDRWERPRVSSSKPAGA